MARAYDPSMHRRTPEVYRFARRRVLQRFLSRPAVYHLPPIREQLEATARRNLERRIHELRTEGCG
jgi:predicted metal-dependent HD superfamily phosphohydrolase